VKSLKSMIFPLLMVFTISCITSRSKNAIQVHYESTKIPKKDIAVYMNFVYIYNDEEMFFDPYHAENSPKSQTTWRRAIVDSYRESNLFTDVQEGFSEAYYKSEITICYRLNWPISKAVISYISLSLFPLSWEEVYTMETKIYDNNGMLIKKTIRDNTIITREIFKEIPTLLVSLPFLLIGGNPGRRILFVEENIPPVSVIAALTRQTLKDMEGVIK